MSDEIPEAVLQVLRETVGLEVNPHDDLHLRLVETVRRLGPSATFGQRVVALRFDFVWELREAGEAFGRAKADYEHELASKVVRLTEEERLKGRRLSLGMARSIAEADAYELKLAYLIAEQRERAMRKFLDALDAALELHRTERADSRAVDRAHFHGLAGGA